MYNENDLFALEAIVAKYKNGGQPPIYETNCLIAATQEAIRLTEKVNELLAYLRLAKFNHPNHWVNVDDVFLRLSV